MKRNTANTLYNGFFLFVSSFGGVVSGALAVTDHPAYGFLVVAASGFVSAVALGARYDDRKIKSEIKKTGK